MSVVIEAKIRDGDMTDNVVVYICKTLADYSVTVARRDPRDNTINFPPY